MGKSAPDPPPAPDYKGAAIAQGAANVDAARTGAHLSNPNIFGPLGSQTVTYNGDDPTVTQSLTPDAQATLDAQQRVQRSLSGLGEQAVGTASGVLGSQFNPQNVGLQTSLPGVGQTQRTPGGDFRSSLDTSGVAALPVGPGMTGQQAIMARLQPQIDQSNKSFDQQMANQGLTAGGEAYGNASRAHGQQANDLISQAVLQGLGLDFQANQQGMQNAINSGNFGNNAAMQSAGLYNSGLNQDYNQGLQRAQFGNQASLQNYQQQLAQYNQPLNQISALMGGSQLQMPQFQQYTGQNVQAAPIANATAQQGQYAQNLYGQQVAQANAQNSAIGSLLGSAAGMFSFGFP